MIRVATFNIENLDDKSDERNPSIEVRAPYLRGTLNRLDADILCLQEVHGQELPSHTASVPQRDFLALDEVLKGTKYEDFQKAHTVTSDGVPYDQRNLVVLCDPSYTLSFDQHRNTDVKVLQYCLVTAIPEQTEAQPIRWERPILHAEITVPDIGKIHVLNLHLKSRLSSNIPGQRLDRFTWKSAAGCAEAFFVSALKRVGQALETRVLIDKIFDEDPDANILVCGDFNAEPGEVPVDAICGSIEDTQNPELYSRAMVPCSNSIAKSRRFSHLHHGQPNLLDHILMSQTLATRYQSSEIFNEALHDESLPFAFDNKYPESDHAAFVAQFSQD